MPVALYIEKVDNGPTFRSVAIIVDMNHDVKSAKDGNTDISCGMASLAAKLYTYIRR